MSNELDRKVEVQLNSIADANFLTLVDHGLECVENECISDKRSENSSLKTNKLSENIQEEFAQNRNCKIGITEQEVSNVASYSENRLNTEHDGTNNVNLSKIPKCGTTGNGNGFNGAPNEPGFVATQLHQSEQQQQKIKTYQNAKQSAVWNLESSDFKNQKSPALLSSSMLRRTTDVPLSTDVRRRVSFPKSDTELVTGYLEPADPWKHASLIKSISEISELYIISCTKHKTLPIQSVLEHLKTMELNKELRQPVLSLAGIKLNPGDCEALEEIFKRVQYKYIDFAACDLDEIATSAIFEMMEYYEATNSLNISLNSNGMTPRGWNSCSYMISHSRALHTLNAQANPLSKSSAENLGSAMGSSNLHTLKLEHCGLKGGPLHSLCFKLRQNKILRELWLAYNDLDYNDAETIGDLLKVNHYIELIDISNNNMKNDGLEHIIKALIIQSHELKRRSMLHRSSAIDADENMFSEYDSNIRMTTIAEPTKNLNVNTEKSEYIHPIVLPDDSSRKNLELHFEAQGNCIRTNDSGTPKSKCNIQNNGQSMLDKMLSTTNVSSSVPDELATTEQKSIELNNEVNKILCNTSVSIDEINDEIKNFEKTYQNSRSNLNVCSKRNDVAILNIHLSKENDFEGVNKSTDDCDDAHSTDSAFESASEGDISRNFLEEHAKSSSSDGFQQIEEAVKVLDKSKTSLPSESTERLMDTNTFQCNSTSTAASQSLGVNTFTQNILPSSVPILNVSINEDGCISKIKGNIMSPTSKYFPARFPLGFNRTETNCSPLNQSTRNRSQSSDSLCSDTSLDGSLSSEFNFSSSAQLNEKITKNDTLTRQTRHSEINTELSNKSARGLKALAVWNNNITKESAVNFSQLLSETDSLELLNIGKNCLSNDFISNIKESLKKNTTLTTLGLQSAHISEKGIEELSMALRDNGTIQRIDIRDNKIETQSLTVLAEALKANRCVTQIDLDDVPKRISVDSEAYQDYTKTVELVRSICARNLQTDKNFQVSDSSTVESSKNEKSGYCTGSRKISLTMASRPLMDCPNSFAVPKSSVNKLDVKRKQGTRLRSPVPSPPAISPSSSPNRSRFQVIRVLEVSPLTSPLTQTATESIETVPSQKNEKNCPTFTISCLSSSLENKRTLSPTTETATYNLSTSSSLPSMANITSSTQSIRRPTILPRSRFHVSKIYEDPCVPLTKRSTPPITPPIMPPPTPIAKTNHVELSQNVPDLTDENVVQLDGSSDDCTNSICNTTNLNSVNYDSFSSMPLIEKLLTSSSCDLTTRNGREMIPSENENTITQSSVKDGFINAEHHVIDDKEEYDDSGLITTVDDLKVLPQARARKVSWIANPTAVDKLLTLFQSPSTLFQKSSSPETRISSSLFISSGDSSDNSINSNIQLEEQTIVSRCASNVDVTDYASTSTTNLTSLEPSRSFLDVATKQLRDLSKQVFSFRQEGETNVADSAETVGTNSSKRCQQKPIELTNSAQEQDNYVIVQEDS